MSLRFAANTQSMSRLIACVNDLGYDFVQDEDDDEEDQEEAALAYLQDNAGVIVFDGGVIIQGF
jgi:uncharacterized protein with ATP-grasp and redox domains